VTDSTPRAAPSQPQAHDRFPAGATGTRRLTIGVLIDNANFFEGCYEADLREALDAKCRREGHNLLLLYGGPLDAPEPAGASDNTIFRTLRPGSCDAIIVVSSMLAAFCGPEPLIRLVESYRPTCLCSIGLALPGMPSLVLDNRKGMEAAIEHLVRDHGVRRPVFLSGTPNNPEAQARLGAFQAVLSRHGIAFDPTRVACGYFMPRPGRDAMESLLAAGIQFDAVVAANDNMALGAIEALRKWGRRVPRDVPVVGFDDLPLAALGNPPLTTVAQPLGRMADLAVEAVLAQLAGNEVADLVVLPSELVRRRSCGCEFEQHEHSSATLEIVGGSRSRQDRIEALQPRLASVLRAHPDVTAEVSQRLVEALRPGSSGQTRAFQKAVGDLLEDCGDDPERHSMLQEAIGWLRDELADLADLELERAFYEGLNLVASSSATLQARRRLTLEDSYATLRDVSEQTAVAFDLSSFRRALVKGLPAAGVRTAFLSCALDGQLDQLTPVVRLVDGQELTSPEASFPASRLLPPSALGLEPRRTFLVFPMAFETQLLGVAAFDYADGGLSYAVFRNEITAVLQTIRLHQELMQKTMLHERSVQERISATKRMEALSVLAGGVAHDLNNALGPLVALPDIILRGFGRLQGDDAVLGKLSADVEIIKTASLRAAQTIKDLLTLGRQGRTVKESIDLNRVVRSCVAESALRLVEDKRRKVSMAVDYASETLGVRGSDSQLARAVGNLLRNAAEAIERDGTITVKTRREHLAVSGARYETIPAGDYAVLTVADDGCGIEPQELGRIFEPFFSKKRTGDSSGSGLGLAIVHGVVKEHEGFLDVVSEPGRGTTFNLYFPLAKAKPESASPAVAAAVRPARLLVVDDEEFQLQTSKRVLSDFGYEVDTVASGERALEAFRQATPAGRSPYDLVIMDMVLEEAHDGLQIIERIRRLFPHQKAIVVSGHAPSERAELAVEKGLLWLPKPYTAQALTRAVERALLGKDGEDRA
jgi:DNA-binding LacI/PurR family transcriptional regulator/signal transduction histidine kinase/CheY-like chemotaxis protein